MKHPIITFDLRDTRWVEAQMRIFDAPPASMSPAEVMAHPMAAQIKFPRPPENMLPVPEGTFFLRDGTGYPMLMDGTDPEAGAQMVRDHSDEFDACWGKDAMANVAAKLMEASSVIALSMILSGNDTLKLVKLLGAIGSKLTGGNLSVSAGKAGDNAGLVDMTDEFHKLGQVCEDCGQVHGPSAGKGGLFDDVEPQGTIADDTDYARVDMIELSEGWMPTGDADGRKLGRMSNIKVLVPVGAQPTWVDDVTDKGFLKHSGCTGKYVFDRCVLVTDREEGFAYLTLAQYPVFTRPEVVPEPRGHTCVPVKVFESLVERDATPDDIIGADEAKALVAEKRLRVDAPSTVQ